MTPDDRTEADALLHAVATELKRSVTVGPSLAARILAEVRRPAHERAWRWVVRPRPVRVSPLGMFAAAAAIAGLVFFTRPSAKPRNDAAAIEFALFAPTAARVTVVGDFNDWDPTATPLVQSRHRAGLWTVDVPLAPGHHEYAFLVDGARWVADPAAPKGGSDEFGPPNSTLTVTAS